MEKGGVNMKKDIFNGKIKKEYYSYILGYIIFFLLLFVVGVSLCIYAFVLEGSFNVSGERALLVVFGVALFALGGGYVFPQLFVISNFPKYPKLRRILFNSDIYFTDSTSNEYFGGSRTIRGRMNKAAFDTVTAFAEVEKGMGKKKPVRYTVYMVFSILFSVIGLAWLFGAPLLFDKGAIFPNISDEIFLFLLFSVDIVFVSLAIIFFLLAYKVSKISSFEKYRWMYELRSALEDIAVRKNNKKLKYWYDKDQLEQIESLVRSASENAELKLETKGDKIISFTVIDTLNNSVVFTGYFI